MTPDRPGGVAVLGLGNVLMGDDAFGPRVVAAIEAHWELGDVEIVDLGTPGFDLLPFLADRDAVVLVDTVHATEPAGTVKRYDLDALLAKPPTQRVSPHDPGVKAALLALQFADRAPREVILFGVVPHDVSQHIGLSPALAAAAPDVEVAVIEWLRRLGHDVRPRAVVRDVSPWWETPQAVC